MYTHEKNITDQIGNNEFSYQERIGLWSLGKIFVPSLIEWNIDDLEEGSEIVFEEIVENKLVSCTGLNHFIHTTYGWIPVYIVDNHNHVLAFRSQYRSVIWSSEYITVLHIDQHADTKPNENKWEISNEQWANREIEDFINTKTNVGNFISAALHNHIIDEVVQIRTEYTLNQFDTSIIGQWNNIVDIDIDFRVGKKITVEEKEIIKNMVKKSKLVTIATSPYFIDQKLAITIIKEIFW